MYQFNKLLSVTIYFVLIVCVVCTTQDMPSSSPRLQCPSFLPLLQTCDLHIPSVHCMRPLSTQPTIASKLYSSRIYCTALQYTAIPSYTLELAFIHLPSFPLPDHSCKKQVTLSLGHYGVEILDK